jgi:hypothetical protein
VQIDGPNEVQLSDVEPRFAYLPRELEADWMYGAAVYVDRSATYCTATHPRSLTGA